jgi:hypothetical protein
LFNLSNYNDVRDKYVRKSASEIEGNFKLTLPKLELYMILDELYKKNKLPMGNAKRIYNQLKILVDELLSEVNFNEETFIKKLFE